MTTQLVRSLNKVTTNKFSLKFISDSISSLQELETGCTIINGSLLIEHMPHAKNLHEHLNEYLGNVQTINGALSISGFV
jgi:hypothetical protein